jgi:hypothetical protein
MILRLSLALLRLFAKVVPARERGEWLAEWESELHARRVRLASRHCLTSEEELDMFRRVLGSFHDAAWLRRQFTLDADVVHDFKHGARLLLRSPGFALLTISVLATGIGATTGIFSVVDALLVRQLPYHDPERIVLVFETDAANRRAIEGVAPANFLDWHQHVSGRGAGRGPAPAAISVRYRTERCLDALGRVRGAWRGGRDCLFAAGAPRHEGEPDRCIAR